MKKIDYMDIFKKRQSYKRILNKNKAQASLFVIAGLLIFLAAIIGIVVYNKIRTSQVEEKARASTLSFQAEEVKKLINDCIKKVGFEGIQRLGQTGGYIDVPGLISFKTTSYWYVEQANIQPFLNQTQQRFIEYLTLNVPNCIDTGNISQYGFLIEKSNPIINVEFGSKDITIKIDYPIKVSKEDFSKEFSEFFNTFDIRYRATYEAATEVNKRLFDADFDKKEPLNKLEYLSSLDFAVSYDNSIEDVLTFTITDKKSITPKNEFYTFTFAAKLGNSSLIKVTDLQNKSATNPTVLPYTIFSTDKKAQLYMADGTTISLNGSDVKQITVQQTYPNEVTTKDVPVYKKNEQIMQRQDITYVIDNPIYTFEPSGLLFNNPQKLTIYYDDETKDDKGVGILMGKKGFWVPIISKHEPEYKKVFSNIFGFTEFTAIYCSSQQLKKTIAEHYFEPNAGCYISLAIMVIAIAAIIVLGPAVLGALAGITSGTAAGAGVTAGITAAVGQIGEAIALTLGATFVTAVEAIAIGALYISFVAISLTSTILSATTDVFYDKSPDNCQSFYPICDQTITIEKQEKDGKGRCIPSGSAQVTAGQPVNVCAFIKKCNFMQKTFCMPCSVKCTASFY